MRFTSLHRKDSLNQPRSCRSPEYIRPTRLLKTPCTLLPESPSCVRCGHGGEARADCTQVLTFLASWLVLLARFSVLNFKHDDPDANRSAILPTPATSYVNHIG